MDACAPATCLPVLATVDTLRLCCAPRLQGESATMASGATLSTRATGLITIPAVTSFRYRIVPPATAASLIPLHRKIKSHEPLSPFPLVFSFFFFRGNLCWARQRGWVSSRRPTAARGGARGATTCATGTGWRSRPPATACGPAYGGTTPSSATVRGQIGGRVVHRALSAG